MTEHIKISSADGIMTIRLNRPEKKNAVTRDMYSAMADAVIAADNDDEIRVIYFVGADGVFCAGNDLADFLGDPPADRSAPVFQFMRALANTDKPVVAAVSGVAVGIGTTMLLHCDVVYASSDAIFSLPFVQLGLCAEFGSSVLLPLLCGRQRASELLLMGDRISPAEAKEIGFLNHIVEPQELESASMAGATKIAAQPRNAALMVKRQLKLAYEPALSEAIEREAAQFLDMLRQDEAQKILNAFFAR